ncbi:MAG: hypothetical protein K2H42_04650, partial [Alistipes sp.]|nr:hypothetical protein [Alistipes sp.]
MYRVECQRGDFHRHTVFPSLQNYKENDKKRNPQRRFFAGGFLSLARKRKKSLSPLFDCEKIVNFDARTRLVS